MHPQTQNIIDQGKVYKFKDLPEEAQLALAHYAGVDGEAWDLEPFGVFEGMSYRPLDVQRNGNIIVANLKKAMPKIVEEKGEGEYGLTTMPTKQLIEAFLEIDSDVTDFDAYHRCYQDACKKTGRGGGEKPTWPVILSEFEDELLQDGWHRFHQYIENGTEEIACLWYPEFIGTLGD